MGRGLLFRLGFGLQFDVAVGDFDRVFHVVALVLLADLFGFFLHEAGEGVDAAGDILSGFFLGSDQSVIEALDLLALRLVDSVQGESLGCGRAGGCCGGGCP